MNDNQKQMSVQIEALFDSQRLAVLATHEKDQPYTSLIAFAASSDLKSLYFMTPDTTRKYHNLTTYPNISILVHNSRNKADDIATAVSVTLMGTAEVIKKSDHSEALNMYLKKHPGLKEFAHEPATAFVRIKIKEYFLVDQFQNVKELRFEA